jgi:hypothetical protein
MEGDEEDFKEIATVDMGESVHASLKVRVGGKAPMFEMECKVTVSLDKIANVPEMVTGALDKIYTQAQEKQLLGF